MSFHSGAVPWRRREQKEGRPFVRTRRSRARSLGATIRRLKPAEDRPIAAWGASGDIAQTNERMNARVVRKSMPESYGAREGGLGDESQAAAATCFRKESLLSIPRGNLSLHTRAGSTTTLFGKFISDLMLNFGMAIRCGHTLCFYPFDCASCIPAVWSIWRPFRALRRRLWPLPDRAGA